MSVADKVDAEIDSRNELFRKNGSRILHPRYDGLDIAIQILTDEGDIIEYARHHVGLLKGFFRIEGLTGYLYCAKDELSRALREYSDKYGPVYGNKKRELWASAFVAMDQEN